MNIAIQTILENDPKVTDAHEKNRAWKDIVSGFICAAIRSPNTGNWCGYVGVKNTHPTYGSDYDELDHIACHGGLTYSENTILGKDFKNMWWFGFDTAHAGDYKPVMEHIIGELAAKDDEGIIKNLLDEHSVYRDIEYVVQNITDVAYQLALEI